MFALAGKGQWGRLEERKANCPPSGGSKEASLFCADFSKN
jgi:hypothetical protein